MTFLSLGFSACSERTSEARTIGRPALDHGRELAAEDDDLGPLDPFEGSENISPDDALLLNVDHQQPLPTQQEATAIVSVPSISSWKISP